MSFKKDKELMQEIHNLIDDYNYLENVISIIKKTYIEEKTQTHILVYEYYKHVS